MKKKNIKNLKENLEKDALKYNQKSPHVNRDKNCFLLKNKTDFANSSEFLETYHIKKKKN